MKNFTLMLVFMLGLALSVQAQESLMLKTTRYETGYLSKDGFKSLERRNLNLTFTITEDVIYVNDKANSRYVIGGTVSEDDDKENHNYSIEYFAKDEKRRECNVRLFISKGYYAIWVIYNNKDIFRYMN